MSEALSVFLDTNVLLDVLWKRNRNSVRLLEQLRLRRIPMYASYLTVLELVDKEQENKFVHKLLLKRYTLDYIIRARRERKLTTEERKDAIDEVSDLIKYYDIHLVVPKDDGL